MLIDKKEAQPEAHFWPAVQVGTRGGDNLYVSDLLQHIRRLELQVEELSTNLQSAYEEMAGEDI